MKVLSAAVLGLMLLSGTCFAKDVYKCQDSELLRSYKVAVSEKDYNNADDMLKALRLRHKGLESSYEYAHIFSTYSYSGVDAAIVEAQKVINMYPERQEGYFWLGYLNLQNEKFDDAIYNLKIAKRIDSPNMDVITNLVYSYYWAGKDKECLAEAKNAINCFEEKHYSKFELEDIVRTYLMGAVSAFSVGEKETARELLKRMNSNWGAKDGDQCYKEMMITARKLLSRQIQPDEVVIPYLFDREIGNYAANSEKRYGYKKPVVNDPSVGGGGFSYPVPLNNGMEVSTSGTSGISVLGTVAAVAMYNHVKHHHYRHGWHHR